MFERLLLGYDGTPPSDDALAAARVLAEMFGSEVTLASVVPDAALLGGYGSRSHQALVHEQADSVIEQARSRWGGGPPLRCELLHAPSPAGALHEAVVNTHADLLIVGSSHHGRIGRVLVGSVSEQALQGAPCPVLVVPRGLADGPWRPNQVAVGYDGGAQSRHALGWATGFAQATGAALHLIQVFAPLAIADPVVAGAIYQAGVEDARADLGATVAALPPQLSVSSRLLEGVAVLELAEASEGMDLLVLGSRGYGPLRRLLLGSVSARIARDAPCPVLVLPREDVPALYEEGDDV